MCNGWLDLVNKRLTSPNYPDPYDPLTFCKWTLTSSEEYYITLDFDTIDVIIKENLSFNCHFI